jgi:Arc/MetJ-type ribon-helix-helix transcriptional regulator
MKSNTSKKSSITLPEKELKVIELLRKKLKIKSNVEVVRQGLKLLKGQLDRNELKARYAQASISTKDESMNFLNSINHLDSENL